MKGIHVKQLSSASAIIESLKAVVGGRNVLSGHRITKRYRTGFRSGGGDCLAVAFPATLVEQWRLIKFCVEADVIVIMQAANTGLTGGSVPDGIDYDRPVVVINTLRINRIDLVEGGAQVICLPGATLNKLELLLKAVNRQPHSVIGSSCIGASIIGGVCNNSGGSQISRGPAYTELAIYARIDDDGKLALINELGVELGSTPEEILGTLDRKEYSKADVKQSDRRASDQNYASRVREIEQSTPARYNANPINLKGVSGSAGKVAVFAVRLDTFPAISNEKIFYVGTNDPNVLTDIRRQFLATFRNLPVAAEYIHRDCFDSARRFGKDTFLMIDWLGTEWMPRFFNLKGRLDSFLDAVPFLKPAFTDRLLQRIADIWPNILPSRLVDFRNRFEHHLVIKMEGSGTDEATTFLQDYFKQKDRGSWISCSEREGFCAFLLRFSAAGAAIRQSIIQGNGRGNMVALDIALPRNAKQWNETLPSSLLDQCEAPLYYGHFFCHVFHQDYVLKPSIDPNTFKTSILQLLDLRGAEYPAEHNVGHQYIAKPTLSDFYRRLDPVNGFNAGVGKMSKYKFYDSEMGVFARRGKEEGD
jgi:D-lactate dehydrogenase (quinone)